MKEHYTEGYFERGEGSNYHQGYEDWPQFKQRAQWFKDHYDPVSVMELGCAKGYMVKHLLDLGIDANGIDISEYAISKSPAPNRVFVRDITKRTLDLSRFDLVVSFDFLEHIPEEDLPKLLESLKTAPAQFHMVTTPEYDFGGDSSHVTMHPKSWWMELFKDLPNCTLIQAGEQKEAMGIE